MTSTLDGPRTTGAAVPPHNLDAEESVLGAVMLSADAANEALERLHPEDFYKPAHQSIFEAIRGLYDANQPIDAITVADALRRSDQLERIGGIEYLTALLERVPTASNVDFYAAIVDETASRRRLMKAGGEVTTLAMRSELPIEEVVDTAEATVLAVAERQVGDGLVPVGPMLQQSLERIEELHERGSDLTGLATGFTDLDRKLAGLQPANLVVIAARPSMGKSTLALNMAEHVASAGTTVAIFTLEMSKEEIVSRLLSGMARVDSTKLRTGQIDGNEWQRVSRAASQLFTMPLYVDDSSDLTITAVRAKCRRLKRKEDLGLVVVDYLQLMQGNARTENRQQEIAEISRSLKNLARELHVPVIAVSQLNRALESREDKRPRLGDLRESGAIEQDADIVMFIYRDEWYNPDKVESKGLAEVKVEKHRSGATGTITMTFNPQITRFGSYTRADPM
ncbi:MAG: replicative DNA helicase [Actinobacteria bacterium]|nr:replicative DNA helicase [Actinomycetota bacterium]